MAVSPEQEQRIKALMQSALELDPTARASFLDRACAGDVSLRQEVESLIAAQEQATGPVSSAHPGKIRTDPRGVDLMAVIGRSIGHYKVLAFLGRGGMGEVYLAQDTRLGRKVALKLLPTSLRNDDDRLRRFEREARSASALSHPNVCVIHEIGETDDERPYIAMEYIEGETLRRRFARGPLTLSDAIDIARQTASALAAAHDAGVVHRDIKPENVMLRRDGYVKVLDFGLAKLTERYEAGSDSEAPTFHIFSTHSGLLIGTTNYLSPEQARRQEVDERADIWSLGVVLYEMVTGHMPFTGDTPSHVIVAILESEPGPLTQFLPATPPELDWIVKKALRKDRDRRYQTIKEFLSDLDEMKQKLDESGASAGQQTSKVQAPPVTRHSSALDSISQSLRRPRVSIAFFSIAMALVGLIGWLIVQRVRNRPASLLQNLEVVKLTNSGNVADAAISPDGKYVVYVADELGKQSLWVRHVPTASSVMIAAADDVRYQGLSYSRDSNYIYYVRQEKDQVGALYKVPVVGTGATRKLASHVDSAVTFSPDGQRLAFVRVGPSTRKLIIAGIDGSAEQELLSGDKTEAFTSPSWSPDNTMIAYGVATFDGGFHMTLVAITVNGGAQTIISSRRWYSIKRLSWLGDNSGLVVDASEQPYGLFQLWHVSYPGDQAERITNDLSNYPALGSTANADALVTVKSDQSTNIWIVRLNDLTRARKLISGVGNYFGVSWFPDGQIAYSSMASGNPDIWSINSDGSGQKQLTANNGANYHPAVSPDGHYIAFTCYQGGHFNICRMDADGSNPTHLTQGDGASFPNWSRDGQWIYYDVLASGSASLWKVRADGQASMSFTDRYSTGPVLSPDGLWISCTYRDDQAASLRYAVIPSGGGAPVKLFGSPDPNRQRMARWTPDNQALLYVDTHDGASNVWLQSLKGNEPKPVTSYESDRIFDFDLSPDGKQLVITRGTTVSDVVLIRGLKKST
jgi:serine/threonine protein kinase/Tol biopolymer transport system component